MSSGARILLLLVPLGYGIYLSWIRPEIPPMFPDKAVVISGRIDAYPEERLSSNRYRIRLETFQGHEITETARILIVTSPHVSLSYGDMLTARGTIERPEDFITDTGKTFDYDAYLRLEKIYGILRDPEILTIEPGSGNPIIRFLYHIRQTFKERIDRRLPKGDAALASGALLGERTGITNSFRDNLARTSTSHIIALSGYNITILAEIIMKSLSALPMLARTLLGGTGIIAFIALSGGGASVLRAGIMAGILLYARARGKEYRALFALALACAILILLQPLALRHDIGFHLSILATFGLITLERPIAVWLTARRMPKFLVEILSSTLAATAMTLPYIAYMIGIVSLVGIFANVIVVPLIPPLMLFSFLTGLIPEAFEPFSGVFAFGAHGVSWIIRKTINTFGGLSWAAAYPDHIPFWIILVIYGFLVYAAFKALQKSS